MLYSIICSHDLVDSVYTILTEKRDNAKVIRARVCVYRTRVLDTASHNASSRVSRSNILETRSKRARKKCIVSAGRYCICIWCWNLYVFNRNHAVYIKTYKISTTF